MNVHQEIMDDWERDYPETPSPKWAKLSDLHPGDTVELHGFNCAQGTVTLRESAFGRLYFDCMDGHHYVESQLDSSGNLVGITIRPADTMLANLDSKVIPITQTEHTPMNLDTKDAGAVSTFFQGLANSVVLASTLPAEVEELRGVVEKLKADVESYREHMARADEEISNLRRERQALQDENANLRSELEIVKRDHSTAEQRWNSACSERDRWHNDYIALAEANETAKRERDDAQIKVMELQDRLERMEDGWKVTVTERDELHAKLSSIRSALS